MCKRIKTLNIKRSSDEGSVETMDQIKGGKSKRRQYKDRRVAGLGSTKRERRPWKKNAQGDREVKGIKTHSACASQISINERGEAVI